MVRILLVVMDFASHRTWAEGFAAAAAASLPNHSTEDIVDIHYIPSDRWKWRMQSGAAAELDSIVTSIMMMTGSDSQPTTLPDVIVVDGMLDVSLFVAMWGNHHHHHHHHRRPKILVYFHENQLTTPFTSQDRDQRNQTHWHYGLTHWRSLLVSDGFIFNSQQHYTVFQQALPKLINEQCPRDTVDWHLQKAQHLLQTKCTVLRYGLALDELAELVQKSSSSSSPPSPSSTTATTSSSPEEAKVPVILWNARLEQDKDPETFLQVLTKLQQQHPNVPFQLVVLGTDPSKGQQWYARIQQDFAEQLRYVGWCNDRAEYAKWLAVATVVVSTAQHETFGISMVESVYCGGALPLVPFRLSYPELFSLLLDEHNSSTATTTTTTTNQKEYQGLPATPYFYSTTAECVEKLANLLEMYTTHPEQYAAAVQRVQTALSPFRWEFMATAYHDFFQAIVDGKGLVTAGMIAEASAKHAAALQFTENSPTRPDGKDMECNPTKWFTVQEETDKRVALYRPKSLRDHVEYHKQLAKLRTDGITPSLHGGRRCTVRMLEALSTAEGANIKLHSFLTTKELAQSILQSVPSDVPVYIAEKHLLDPIRGQKLNAGDAILMLIWFPLVSPLVELMQRPPILILENVRNAENLGSILRTAFCLGITSIVASSTSWAALSDSRSARCSMGTIYYHRFYKSETLEKTIAEIKQNDIRIYGIEIGPEATPIKPHGFDRKWAAVLGNEDLGMALSIREVCDSIVFVPQAHGDSLNVGHAAAISMFELGRESPMPQHDGKAACK